MSNSPSILGKGSFNETALTALRLGLVLIIVYWCYQILLPFIPLVVWGAIIAVAIYPLHLSLAARLGHRIKVSATLITLLGLIVLTAPVVVLTESVATSAMGLASAISEGSVLVPPPSESVQAWPLVGERLYSTWLLASENLDAALQRFGPQLEVLRGRLIVVAESAGAEFLKLFFSMIVAGIFLGAAKGTMAGLRSVVNWLVGERSSLLLDVSATTVRSVARGVLGAAMLETIVAGIGMFAAGVPAFGFWAFLILVLSIIQVPPLLPLVPIGIYVFSTAAPIGATVFVICAILAVAIDTFLKPILLGRGANVPMLIVLMGAIGGMILSGIVGLFAGAVVLVLGWELLQFCIHEGDAPATQPPGPPQGAPAE